MENNVEIILMGSVNRLIDLFDGSIIHDCINIFKSSNNLLDITLVYNGLICYMKNHSKFTDTEYILKELTEEEEDKYLALFAITDKETIKDIIYEELKHLPTSKYPREE